MLCFVSHRIYNTSISGKAAINRRFARLFYPPTQSCTAFGPMGQALNRDPLGERGGKNLYGFCRNNSARYVDRDGREIVFDGDQDVVDAAKNLFEEAKAKANAELQGVLHGMETDSTTCKIRVTWKSDLVVVGNFNLGIIDLGDIYKLPASGGGLTIHAAFVHELYEQWQKAKGEKAFQTAHEESLRREVQISGNRRVDDISKLHLGWNPFSQVLSGRLIFMYRRVISIDKDGKEVLDSKTVIQTIIVDDGAVTSSTEK